MYVGGALIGVQAPSGLGGEERGDSLARKHYAIPESVRVEIGMQTETFTVFASNETVIIREIESLHT